MKIIATAQLIDWIIADVARSLQCFKSFSPKQTAKANTSIKRYRKSLDRLSKKGAVLIEIAALHSFDAHFCAVLRAAARAGLVNTTFSALREMALRAREGHAASEAVIACWIDKDNDQFRLIVKFGILRNARSFVFRDVLTSLGYESPYDYSRRGAGGERAFVGAIASAISSGKPWVATADIKRCFASMRPAHFKWVPLSKQLLRKEVFISSEAKIEAKLPENVAKLWKFVQSQHSATITTSIQASIVDATTQMVRQALPEGGLLSPLLARSFIGREIQATLGSKGVAPFTFVDDLASCACAQPTAAAAMHALEMRLKSHPAGPIELHAKHVRNANEWKTKGHTSVLKYLLEPGNGFGATKVHVKPGRLRLERFIARLKKKLDQAKAEGNDLYDVGLSYWCQWFASQQAWTKVPGQSEIVSEMAAMGYIDEYTLGIKMGSTMKMANQAT